LLNMRPVMLPGARLPMSSSQLTGPECLSQGLSVLVEVRAWPGCIR
jgi:hypothetical protein